jgi:integral membrane sensor domain MASE1
MPSSRGRPAGLVLLIIFFAVGALIALVSCIALLTPGGPLQPIWRLNPGAYTGFARMGGWAPILMVMVTLACGSAAIDLARRRAWGRRLAIGILGVNLLGDLANAVVRGDLRTLIGLPIGGFLIAYLLSRKIREYFEQVQSGGEAVQ